MQFGFIFIMILLVSGCTSQLWQPPSYKERVTGFYAQEQARLLLIAGEQYSYVFTVSDVLIKSLQLSREMELIPHYSVFKLDEDNHIRGTFKLTSNKTEDNKVLKEQGFPVDKYGNVVLEFELKGKRYTAQGDYPFQRLASAHHVVVETPESGASTAGKIIVTPLTIAIDATTVVPVGAFFTVLGVLNKS
ncbi:hypothetical protein JF50_11860 [Pseudoalteromonas luteoviolacea]|uniref:Uncharacterized protein n=1 Tax=Pseudoalteromonas luteoviolacea TaxID=43657 RepID=A0A0C1QB47_9GAMM|nr:hypothetical protein [Pseudoalteromonas luteoviolacea]KID56620.1 hypothetical protein JF50_11860 [Pseudoalteromonas luteoviolacea]